MTLGDCARISKALVEQGWDKPPGSTITIFRKAAHTERVVLLAEYEGQFAGYVTLVWESEYPPFRAEGIPEIADFNVLIKYRRRGIGTALMDAVEQRATERSVIIGLGVGLTADHGAAQILIHAAQLCTGWTRSFQGVRSLQYGEHVRVDDEAGAHLTKRVQ